MAGWSLEQQPIHLGLIGEVAAPRRELVQRRVDPRHEHPRVDVHHAVDPRAHAGQALFVGDAEHHLEDDVQRDRIHAFERQDVLAVIP